MRDLLAAKKLVLGAIGDLDPSEAASLLRDLAGELDPQGITDCSGVTAAWCQVHGDCTCPKPEKALDDPSCPLHAPDSGHAEVNTKALKQMPMCWTVEYRFKSLKAVLIGWAS